VEKGDARGGEARILKVCRCCCCWMGDGEAMVKDL